jgi:hypothetical protein
MESLHRLGAVVSADLRSRLRRPSALVLTAGAAVAAVLAIPDPAPGGGLLRIAGARALYTSSTLAFATAVLLCVVLSFFGFYVVRHAVLRDARLGLGFVIASTPVSKAEYLAGKVVASVALLAAVSIGFLLASMAMQVVRGEGPLEPATFIAHYAVLALPCIVWVSVLALLFECVPGLSGRFGDLLYFVVWGASVPLGLQGWKSGFWIGRVVDFMGLGFVVSQVEMLAGTGHFSIGWAPGDAAKPPVHFPGLSFPADVLLDRGLSLVAPLLLLPLAVFAFRRFDPAREGDGASSGRLAMSALARRLLGAATRPLVAPLFRIAPDLALAFRARPLLAALVPVFATVSLLVPASGLRVALLPVLFAVLSLALADVATRERSAGLEAIVFAAPGCREGFARWKLATALGMAALLAGVPVLRLLWLEPAAGLSAAIGAVFLAAASVALGIATGTPRAFVALSLALWYLGLNAADKQPALDYAGWGASATPATKAGWLTAAVLAIGLAFAAQRYRLARES